MKKFLIGLAALVVLLLVAALVAPFLIPTDTYKTRLIALVKEATGRDLKIGGAVRLSFLPALAVEAGDVSFANAPGARDPDMMRLKKLEVELSLFPLLHGSVELGRFILTEPQIALEIDKSGKPNWVFATTPPAAPARPGAAPAAAPQSAPAGGGGAMSELRLDDVRLVNGKISYTDDRTGKTETLDAIAMKLALPGMESPFAGEGSAVWHGEKVALSIGIAKPGALSTGKESGFSIKIEAAPITLGFAGAMTGVPPAKLGGTIDLAVPSIRGLAKWAGAPMPDGPGLQKLAIKGRIDMEGAKISFSNAAIAIDAITANGSLAVTTAGAKPHLQGTLAVDKLDVNPYLPPEPAAGTKAAPAAAAGGASAPAGSAAAAGWSDAPIDVSGLGLADADFDLKAGGILYRKIVIGDSALDLHIKDSKLTANLSRLLLYQGQGQGKVAVDGSGAAPTVAMNFALSGVQVEPLLAAAAGTDRVSGTGKINLDVQGAGKSQRALISALNGKGAFDLANGQIKGVNLIALAQNATSSLTGTSGDSKTDFGSATGTFTITNGIVKNSDLQVKSGLVPITGGGTVDLPKRTVDYRVVVSLVGAINVPVLVSGPWDNLSYHPDLAGALTGTAQGALKAPGQIMDKLLGGGSSGSSGSSGGSSSGPTSVLKNLFGK